MESGKGVREESKEGEGNGGQETHLCGDGEEKTVVRGMDLEGCHSRRGMTRESSAAAAQPFTRPICHIIHGKIRGFVRALKILFDS